MNRLATIYRQKSLASSGEETYDINVRDPITAFYVEFRNTNGASYNRGTHIADDVDEIQVIDGSDVLFNMTGEELFAYNHYLGYKSPAHLFSEWPGLQQQMGCWIPFGRFRNDPIYGLDPTRFSNLQFRIKWSFSEAATAWAASSLKFSLFADVMMGVPAPSALIMAKEIKSWTTSGSGDERTELPHDYPYLGVLVQARKAATAPDSVLTDLKFTLDTDRLILLNNDLTDLLKLVNLWYGPLIYHHNLYATDATTIYLVTKKDEVVEFVAQDRDDTVFRYADGGAGEGTLSVDTAGSAQTSATNIMALVRGFQPYAVLYWPFGRHAEPQEWLSVEQFSRFELVATQGSASGEARVCVVQARAY